TRNMAIDTTFYPLGSCTMKYNPKRHERLAGRPGFAAVHPLQDDDTCQGMLQLLFELQEYLKEISGLDACSLQPAAGAQRELTALPVAAAYFRHKGEAQRARVLVPDSAHGTNPASAVLAGFESVTVKSNVQGLVDLDDLKAKLDERTTVFMITNPNTLGLFDHQITAITELLHAKGALVYLDGANMNAILGITRPGDFGVDMQHYNVTRPLPARTAAADPAPARSPSASPWPRFCPPRWWRETATTICWTTTVRNQSAGCAASSAPLASFSAVMPTSARSARTGCARSASRRSSTPTTCWPA